jgi:arginine decarboxylase
VALKEAFHAYVKIREKNPGLDTINMGGGFAIPYEKKKLYSAESVVYRIIKLLKDLSVKEGIPHPNIIVEWGRYIAAPSQITVYSIVASKEIPKAVAKKWCFIDGSFINDLLDTWAIRQKWHIVPVNNINAAKRDRVWLAGLTCDSDDKYVSGEGYSLLPSSNELEPGDSQYLAVLDTGAYQDAFTSHHCLLSSPAKILLQNGIVTVIRRRETPDDVGKIFGW